MSAAQRIVGEKHLLPRPMAVGLALTFGYDPPPVLISGLNKLGQVVATAPLNWHRWRFEYITMRTQK